MKRRNFLQGLFIMMLLTFLFNSCENRPRSNEKEELVIFFINDHHSQIDNFSKIKYIVDNAGEEGNIIIASSGDMFSGNPLVDFYEEKGYPVIDLMNRIGFDLATIGNHEYDYGQEILQDRIDQAEFEIISANIISESPLLEQPPASVTITVGDLDISFVGVVETNGKPGAVIPSTHPGKLENLSFVDASDILDEYSDFKEETESDLLILLSHLGHDCEPGSTCDYTVAENFPFFDAIIGGHSHSIQDTSINGVHIYQAGAYLNYLGKISFTIKESEIISESFKLIDLDDYPSLDENMQALIDDYNNNPAFSELIGYNENHLVRNRTVGCFYTDAIREYAGADMSIQNPGGIRADLDEGDISIMDIYRIDPFGNELLGFELTVAQIKKFLGETGAGFYYSGVVIETDQYGHIVISDMQGNPLDDSHSLSLAINNYIPMVHEDYFHESYEDFGITTAEAMIEYVRNLSGTVNYESCVRYFRYEE